MKNRRVDGPNKLVRSAKPKAIPMRKQPMRFANRVPQGNRLSMYLAVINAIAYLLKAPKLPPSITKIIFAIKSSRPLKLTNSLGLFTSKVRGFTRDLKRQHRDFIVIISSKA
jgi:hypothetical protein